ncbi:hypothetical protein BDN72DRAFT_772991, partial [Pluteus cervinus]
VSPFCRYGCQEFESAHHIFVSCPHFHGMRAHAKMQLLAVEKRFTNCDNYYLLSSFVDDLSRDSHIWPSGSCYFYLGLIPEIVGIPGEFRALSESTKGQLVIAFHAVIHTLLCA